MAASIQKKGGAYYVVFRNPATQKQKWVPAGRTTREARVVLHEIEAQLMRNEYKELRKATFREFAGIWLRDYPRLVGMKRSTESDYRSAFNAIWFKAPFADADLGSIAVEDVERYVAARLQQGLSARRMADVIVPLKTMFKWAAKWHYLWANPISDLKKPKYETPEMDFLTPEEAHRIVDAIDPYYRPMLLFALMTGVRPGELIAIRWRDIDLQHRLVSVRYTLDRGELLPPKTDNARRRIPLPPELIEILEAHKRSWVANPLGLVFVTPVGSPIDLSNWRNRVFHTALERAGVRRVRTYDLRHTYAAWMISLNVEPLQLQKNLGHYDLGFTYRTYGHLMPASGHDEAARLGAMFTDADPDGGVAEESVSPWRIRLLPSTEQVPDEAPSPVSGPRRSRDKKEARTEG